MPDQVSAGAGHGESGRGGLPSLPLKSKLPTLCGSILMCELLIVYLALLMGYGLRPVSVSWLLTGAAVLAIVCVTAAVTLPRRVGQQRPGVALGWLVQVLILLSGCVMAVLFVVALIFGSMWAVAVYWGRRIDREATEWVEGEIARARGNDHT